MGDFTAWDEAVPELRRLWNNGESAGVIAATLTRKFGGMCTRNSVIGKVHRLGLSGRKRAAVARQPPKVRAPSLPGGAAAPVSRPQNNSSLVARERAKAKKPAADKVESAGIEFEPIPDNEADQLIDPAQRKTFAQLGPRDCRFGVGDPGHPAFFFCGGNTLPGKPYCSAHAARCYGAPKRLNISDEERERRRRQAMLNNQNRRRPEAVL